MFNRNDIWRNVKCWIDCQILFILQPLHSWWKLKVSQVCTKRLIVWVPYLVSFNFSTATIYSPDAEMPLEFTEEGERLADQSACANLRAQLKMCLLESECCRKVRLSAVMRIGNDLKYFRFSFRIASMVIRRENVWIEMMEPCPKNAMHCVSVSFHANDQR